MDYFGDKGQRQNLHHDNILINKMRSSGTGTNGGGGGCGGGVDVVVVLVVAAVFPLVVEVGVMIAS